MKINTKGKTLCLWIIVSLVIGVVYVGLPFHTAHAVGGPVCTVAGASDSAANGMYTDGASEWNGKCYYFGPGGSWALAYSGSRWELLRNLSTPIASSSSVNPSNAKLPPTSGWSSGVSVSYGPNVSFDKTAVSVNEENGSVSLKVNLSEFPMGSNINYATSNGTAVSGSDYNGVSSSVFVNGGESYIYISIGIINDSVYESNETFTVTISNDAGTPVTNGTCTVTIISDDPQTTVGFSSATKSASENSGTVSIPVTLNVAGTSDVTVQYATSNVTASAGSDYTAASGTLTIPAGSTSGNIDIALNNDNVYEGNETFALTLSNPTNALLAASAATITVTDDETQPTVGFDNETPSAAEGDSDISLNVSLSGPCKNNVSVNYATADGSASAGSDFTAKSGVLTIPAGSTTASIVVALLDDSVYEGSETFTAALTSPTVAALGTALTTVTLSDNEAMPSVNVASSTVNVAENAGKATITVSLTGVCKNDVTVDYLTSDGTAGAGTDYTSASGTLTIPAGSLSGNIEISISDDSVYEGGGSLDFTVTLQNPSGANLGSSAAAAVSITDNESMPEIRMNTAAVTIHENSGTVSLPVTLSGASDSEIMVDYATIDSTAKAGNDYTSASGTLTFPALSTSGTISVTIVDDSIYETLESFSILLSNEQNASLPVSSYGFNINDNEPDPVIGLASSAETVSETSSSVTLSVSLSQVCAMDVTVDYATSDATASGGSDYTVSSGSLTISAGDTAAVISIGLSDDSMYDGDETFTVTLSNPTVASLGGSTATVTILDDEPEPAISVNAASVSTEEADHEINVTVTLSGVCQRAVTVDYATADGTAYAGSDYTALSGTLTFPSGSTTPLTVTMTIKGDAVYEGNENFTFVLSGAHGARVGAGTQTVTIQDNESMPVIGLIASSAPVDENAGSVNLGVTMSGVSQYAVTADYAIQDDTTTSGADYTPASGTLTITGGSSAGTITVSIIDDDVYEGTESFTLTLQNASGVTISSGADDAVVTILDNDVKPRLYFTSTVFTANENAGKAILEVALSGKSKMPVTVDYVTADGSAKAPADYTASSGTLTVPALATTGSVEINLSDDSLYEGSENFSVTLSNISGADLGDRMAAVNIVDNETVPVLGFSSGAFSAGEDGGKASLDVVLSGASQRDITVDYETADNTAAAGSDYSATAGTLTIPGGSVSGQIEIPISDDTVYEGDEYFTVSLKNLAGAALGANAAAVTIRENEAYPEIGFTAETFGIGEDGGTVTLSVSLSVKTKSDITVNYATSDDTAAAGQDYTASTGTLTITAGSTAGSIVIPVLEDTLYENDENFTVTLSAPSGASLSRSATKAVIHDNDTMPKAGFDPTAISVNESAASADFSVKLSAVSGADTSIPFETKNLTAMAGKDYVPVSGTLTIPAGYTSGILSVLIVDDDVYEGTESFALTLKSATGAILLESADEAAATVTDNESMPRLDFDSATVTVDEYNNEATLAVTLSGKSQAPVTVDYASSDGTAEAGKDYTAASGTLTIPSLQTTGSIVVSLSDDSLYEGNEDLSVVLTNIVGAVLGVHEETVTIADDETMPLVGFSSAMYSVQENGGKVTLDVTLSGLSQADITASFTAANGTATAGTDYTASSGTLTIPGGSLSGQIEIILPDDIIYEGDEDFTVTLTHPHGATLDTATATVTIQENDSYPEVGFTAAVFDAGEGEGYAALTVSLTVASKTAVTVAYDSSDVTAAAGLDYTAAAGTLTIPAGQVSALVKVTIKNDALYENNETFSAHLSNPAGATLLLKDTIVTIQDNDAIPNISFYPTTHTVNESAGILNVNVKLSAVSGLDATVLYETKDGTAISGEDYTAVSGTLTIPAGSTSGTVTVPILDNDVYESSESLTIVLSNATNAAILTSASEAAVSVTDDEVKPRLDIAAAAVIVDEIDASVTLSVTLSGKSQADIAVDYSTINGLAEAGSDYTLTAGTLTIPSLQTSGSIVIPLTDDSLYEGDEDFTVTLSSISGAVLGDHVTKVTITDDETIPSLGFSTGTLNVDESLGKAVLDVQLTGFSQANVTVNYASANGTALSGKDYTSVSGKLTIPGGSLSGQIEIPILDDIVYEGDEDFTVKLTAPNGALLDTDTALITILENEAYPEAGFMSDTFEIGEEDGRVTLTVSLSVASKTAITLDYQTSDGTALAGQDYTAATGTLTIPAGSTSSSVKVVIKNDALYENGEDFSVALSNPTGATLKTSAAMVTINDNDAIPKAGFTPAAITVNESEGTAILTVKLSAVSGADAAFRYDTVDGAAKAGEDFDFAFRTLIIPAGSTSGTISLSITDDTLYEHGEDFVVKLTEPLGAVLTSDTASVSITDNDVLPMIGFDEDSFQFGEADGQAALLVKISAVSGVDASVNYATVDGTALNEEDYTETFGTLVIPAGSTEGLILVPITDDELYEDSENFTVTLSLPAEAALAKDTADTLLTESKAAPVITIAPISVRESVGYATLTVSLDRLSTRDITVAYTTKGRTAKAGSDYLGISGTLTIPALSPSGTINVRIYNDDLYEGTESLYLILSDAVGGTLGTDQALLTIRDNDPMPTETPEATSSLTPAPTITPAPALSVGATATPSISPTATPTPTVAPAVTINPGTRYVDVQEEVVAAQENTDEEQNDMATVVNVDEEMFERTVTYARSVIQDTGADVILRFPDIIPLEDNTTMRLNLLSDQVLSVAQEGIGVSVKMENVTFDMPANVLSQAASDTENISLECRTAQDESKPYFKIDLGNGTLIGHAYSYALAVTHSNGDISYVDQFRTPVTITVQLTMEEAAAITNIDTVAMRYINPATGRSELLPSLYDPEAMTLTFNTTYFGETAEEEQGIA